MLNLVRTHRAQPYSYINDFLNDAFFNCASNIEKHQAGFNTPAVNVGETDEAYVIDVAAPGIDKKDFKVNLENNVLTISSENNSNNKDEKDGYVRKEFSYSSFSRSFTLPKDSEAENIEASHHNGVLKIRIPKAEEKQPKPLDIQIK
jgi:HSP20 family protein